MKDNGFKHTLINLEVKYLTAILDDISKGILRVPNFHRSFIWKPINILGLLDSIYKGYPIGNLIFFKTKEQINTSNKFGPFYIPSISEINSSYDINYIVDGYQRLVTLYGVLMAFDNQNYLSQEKELWNVYFDLEQKKFSYFRNENVPQYFFPLRNLLRTTSFLKQCRQISNEYKEGEILIKESEILLYRIRNYMIGVTHIKGSINDLSIVFSRINSQGITLSQEEIEKAKKNEKR